MTKRINLAELAENIQDLERRSYLSNYMQRKLGRLRSKFRALLLRRQKFDAA